jgi:hypothetical protein
MAAAADRTRGGIKNAPVVSATGPAEVDMANTAQLVGTATDDGLPSGSTLTVSWSKVSGPGTAIFMTPLQPVTDVRFDAAGTYVLRLTATDGALTSTADVYINVVRTNHAPVVNAGVDQTLAAGTTTATLAGSATDDGLPEGAALSYAWMQLGGPAVVRFANDAAPVTGVTFTYPGTYVFGLTVSDSALVGSDDVTVTVNAPAGGMPVVSISGIDDDGVVTKPVQISGTISEGSWSLDYRLGGRDDVDTQWTVLASGTGSVSGGVLGTFDPTLLLNGMYTIRLSAKTTGGEQSTSVAVAVDGRMKIGNFTLAFTDLDVPVSGLPIQLIRTYDSRDKKLGDFGVGWNLSIRNVRVEKSGKTGAYWRQKLDDSGFFTQYCLEPSRSTSVTVTMPSGRQYKFRPKSEPRCQFLTPITTPDIVWESTSDPDNPTIKLQAVGGTSGFVQGPAPGPVQIVRRAS